MHFAHFALPLYPMSDQMNRDQWKETVILVDTDYVDKVAFNLIVNFERMLERPIPKASMAQWVDCVALDGGLRPGDNETQVVLIHSKEKQGMDNFEPSNFADELTGKAFRDNIGEFVFDAYPTEEDIVRHGDFFAEALQLTVAQKEVKRIMVIPNAEDADIYNKVRALLKDVDEDRRITVFAMEPKTGGNFRQEILGYSLMAALGIRSDEINSK